MVQLKVIVFSITIFIFCHLKFNRRQSIKITKKDNAKDKYNVKPKVEFKRGGKTEALIFQGDYCLNFEFVNYLVCS